MTRVLLGILVLAGCTRNNPNRVNTDVDLAVSLDGGFDLAVPDLGAADLAGVDLAFSTDAAADLAPVRDLSSTDLLIRCGDAACFGCCASGRCVAFGDSCNAPADVCTRAGCVHCGENNEACCRLLRCNSGFVCNNSLCRDCGAPSRSCCSGNQCAGGGCCVGSTCVASGDTCGNQKVCLDSACVDCGDSGEPCCNDTRCVGGCCNTLNRTCVVQGAACGNGTCDNGACGGCGTTTVTQACCSSGNSLVPDHCSVGAAVCDDRIAGVVPNGCFNCGGDTQKCCGGNTCYLGGCCVEGNCKGNTMMCTPVAGNCFTGGCGDGTCGRAGQACCAGDRCTGQNTRCIDGICNLCGGRDQRCCVDPDSNLNIFCEPPFVPSIEDPPDASSICFCRRS